MKKILLAIFLLCPTLVLARARKAPPVKPAKTTATAPQTEVPVTKNDELSATMPSETVVPSAKGPMVPSVQVKFGIVQSVNSKINHIKVNDEGRFSDVAVTEKTLVTDQGAGSLTLPDLKPGDHLRYTLGKDGSVERIERLPAIDIGQ